MQGHLNLFFFAFLQSGEVQVKCVLDTFSSCIALSFLPTCQHCSVFHHHCPDFHHHCPVFHSLSFTPCSTLLSLSPPGLHCSLFHHLPSCIALSFTPSSTLLSLSFTPALQATFLHCLSHPHIVLSFTITSTTLPSLHPPLSSLY